MYLFLRNQFYFPYCYAQFRAISTFIETEYCLMQEQYNEETFHLIQLAD